MPPSATATYVLASLPVSRSVSSQKIAEAEIAPLESVLRSDQRQAGMARRPGSVLESAMESAKDDARQTASWVITVRRAKEATATAGAAAVGTHQ